MFHVAGDILDTSVEEICSALSGTNFRVRVDNDEVRIGCDDADFDVYPCRPGRIRGEDFLVSGAIDGPEQNTRTRLKAIAHALATADLIYNFEVDQEDEAETILIVRHPEF